MLQATIQLYRNAYTGMPKPIWWLALVMLVNRSGTMVIPFLTVYLTNSGYTLSQAGFVMATFGVGAVLGGYLGGRLTDRFGFFWTQIGSLLMSGVFFIILGYMQGLWQIALCVFALSSLGEAFRPANAAAIAVYSDETNRTRSYSLNRLAVNLGWAIGPAIGGLLASIDYHLLFWVDGFTCIFASLLLYFFLAPMAKDTPEEKKTEVTASRTTVYKDRLFLQGMLFLLLVVVCFFQLFSILPVYYKEDVRLSEAVIGWILASNGFLIALIEMVLVYRLERRSNPMTYMVYGAFLIGLSFLLLTVAPLLAIVLTSMFVITFGEMLLFPFVNNFWVSRTSNTNRGQYAALYTMTFAMAHVLAPLLASWLAFNLGFKTLFITDFILCSLAALGFIWLRKQKDEYGKL